MGYGMIISKSCLYALRIIIDLSNYSMRQRIHIAEISERRNIPRKYLEQILLKLKKSGIIQSKKGPKGGYRLSKPPGEITIGEIVRLMEKSYSNESFIKGGNTPAGRLKTIETDFFGVFEKVTNAAFRVMDNITFEDIKREEAYQLSAETAGNFYDI
jgi:Rrf2 family protein